MTVGTPHWAWKRTYWMFWTFTNFLREVNNGRFSWAQREHSQAVEWPIER